MMVMMTEAALEGDQSWGGHGSICGRHGPGGIRRRAVIDYVL